MYDEFYTPEDAFIDDEAIKLRRSEELKESEDDMFICDDNDIDRISSVTGGPDNDIDDDDYDEEDDDDLTQEELDDIDDEYEKFDDVEDEYDTVDYEVDTPSPDELLKNTGYEMVNYSEKPEYDSPYMYEYDGEYD